MMIDLTGLIALLCAGSLAGFCTGFFGAGGGIIIVPVLILLLEASGVSSLVTTHLAIGTSLCVVIFAVFGPSYRAVTSGSLTRKSVVLVSGAGIMAAIVGTILASGLEGGTLRLLFGVVVLIPVAQLLGGGQSQKRETEKRIAEPALVGSGLVMGFVSSLTGIEASVPGIPMTYRLMSYPLKGATALSNVAATAAAFASSLVYVVIGSGNTLLPAHALGYVDYLAAIPLVIGTVPSVWWGSVLLRKRRPGRARKYYGVILLAIAVKMILF